MLPQLTSLSEISAVTGEVGEELLLVAGRTEGHAGWQAHHERLPLEAGRRSLRREPLIALWGPQRKPAQRLRWGERSCPEYLLLKRSFGTRTRGKPARKNLKKALFSDFYRQILVYSKYL